MVEVQALEEAAAGKNPQQMRTLEKSGKLSVCSSHRWGCEPDLCSPGEEGEPDLLRQR